MERKQIGVVGVDSGQIMVTDPCYVKDFQDRDEDGGINFDLDMADNGGYPYSYEGACNATGTEKSGGQLNYALGHEGAGVVASSGYGDGVYPVYAEYADNGRVARIVVEFMEDNEDNYTLQYAKEQGLV